MSATVPRSSGSAPTVPIWGTSPTWDPSAAPFGIGIDSDGNIWVSEFSGNLVQKFSPAGGLLLTLSGFGQPTDVAFDGSGHALVSNFNTNQIFTYTLGGAPVDVTSFDSAPYGMAVGPGGPALRQPTVRGPVSTCRCC